MAGQTVQSVDRALEIMEVLSVNPKGITLTDLSNEVCLNKSTTYRLLSALEQRNYVTQDTETKKYMLTLKLFEMGNRISDRFDIVTVATPFMRDLAEVIGEVCHLAIRDGNQIVYVAKESGDINSPLMITSHIGLRDDMYCCSLGKAILSTLSLDEVAEIWDGTQITKFTENTITTLPGMIEALETIRVCGYAVDDEEHVLGIRCIAAPIFNNSTQAVAAISVASPSIRMSQERIKELAPAVMNVANRISANLGYRIIR